MEERSTQVRTEEEPSTGPGRRPLYAAVGAGELAVTQLKELPALTQAQIERLQAVLRERAGSLSPESVREVLTGSLAFARSVYDGLSERGERASDRMVARVRSQPHLRRVFGGLADALDHAEDAIEGALEGALVTNGNGSGTTSGRRGATKRIAVDSTQ